MYYSVTVHNYDWYNARLIPVEGPEVFLGSFCVRRRVVDSRTEVARQLQYLSGMPIHDTRRTRSKTREVGLSQSGGMPDAKNRRASRRCHVVVYGPAILYWRVELCLL